MLYLLELGYCVHAETADESHESHIRTTPRLTSLDPASFDPHHVLVVYGHNYCSGSIIGSKMVLTVASCFETNMREYDIYVKFGCRNFLDEGQVIAVLEKKQHEYFQYKSPLDNDIALLLLETHVEYDKTVKKILLVEPDVTFPVGSMITVTGWGGNSSAKSSERYIIRSRMMFIDEVECSKAYMVTSSMFCAKYDVKSRLSDSGGAAVHRGMVVGVASYWPNGERKPHVALFTNVSYFYKWIKLNTERLLTKHCSDEDNQESTKPFRD